MWQTPLVRDKRPASSGQVRVPPVHGPVLPEPRGEKMACLHDRIDTDTDLQETLQKQYPKDTLGALLHLLKDPEAR